MAPSQADWGEEILGSVKHGVVALLARRVTQEARAWGRWDLVIACSGALLGAKAVHGPAGVTRLSGLLASVVQSILFGAVLEAVRSSDPALDAPTLLGLHLLLTDTDVVSLGGSAQYLFAERVAGTLASVPDVGFAVAVMIQAYDRYLVSVPRLQQAAKLVAVDLATTYVQSVTPAGMELPSTLFLAFLCHPDTGATDGLGDVYSYAIYSSCDQLAVDGLPAWMHGVCGVLLWRLSPETVSAALGQLVSTHFLSQALMDAVQVIASTDPALAALAVAVGIGVMFDVSTGG